MSTLPPIRQPNRLQHEKSPYLQQHAMNPVDWHPWGNEAIAKAEAEQKPIFLSIGYSTCHWCHVMERESFEDESVADVLNKLFVPVKVDREERPDVDRLYMTAMQALGMGGGWPLNVFLTPALEPFYGGTYFPPRSVPGRIGMIDLLPRVRDAWESARDDVVKQGESIMAAIANIDSDRAETSPGRTALYEGCLEALTRTQDAEWGGFGRAPKFPQVVNLDFLFRCYARDPARNGRALDMALRQLDAMRRGGIHDHVGGGFHRYSTDREWLVPHFEKMLYDQAQLAMAFLDAARLTGHAEYADVARGVLDSVSRDLSAPGGAFASAEDADSEGEEGLFYVWTEAQLAEALPADLAQLVALHYGVTDGGNFEHGTSILHEARAIEETATRAGLAPDAVRTRLAEARATLLAARSRRVRPHRDDKVLAAWNGLMIAAFARGARVLDDPALATRAAEAAEFVWTKLRDPATGEMRRRFRDGEVAVAGQLDDYAYMAYGAIELYRATLDPEWLDRAVALTEAQIERFWDDERGGFFESPADDPHLKVRLKDEFDGAEIAGNSIALDNLIVLAELLDSTEWRELARLTADHFERKLARHPIAMPRLLAALMLDEPPRRHVVVAGRRDAADTRALIRAFDARFRPGELLLLVDDASRPRIAALAPFAASLVPQDGRATAYVCVDYACRLPVTDPAAFAAQLDEAAAPLPTGEAR